MKTSLKLSTLLAAFLPLISNARAQGTVNATTHHTWAANAGWINWQASGATGAGAWTLDSFLSGKIWSANCGWLTLGDGTPANGWHYANTTGEDSGVNLNANGTLTGLAWGANFGWLNFEQTTGKPKLNYATGEFSGFAWSANCGWINLGGSRLITDKLFCPDTDLDGMSDTWEMQHFGNLSRRGQLDADGDGQSDAAEFAAGTDPLNAASILAITGMNLESPPEAYYTATGLSPNRLYTLETSTDLLTWSALTAPALPIGPAAVFDTTFDPAGPRRFWRIRAQKPLP